jgi:hypothetical protein
MQFNNLRKEKKSILKVMKEEVKKGNEKKEI